MLRNMTAIYITFENKMLLLYRIGSKVVQPSWCGIGGHFEKEELNNPKACVLRELFEETGIKENDLENIEFKYAALRLKNGEIRQNYYYFAKLRNAEIDIHQCNEGKLQWVDMDHILEKKMPFTAKECLKHYLSVGRYDDKPYAGITTEEGINFVELKEF